MTENHKSGSSYWQKITKTEEEVRVKENVNIKICGFFSISGYI